LKGTDVSAVLTASIIRAMNYLKLRNCKARNTEHKTEGCRENTDIAQTCKEEKKMALIRHGDSTRESQ
jgi:hypothetical protein